MLASFTSILPSIGFGSTKDDSKDKSPKEQEPVSLPARSEERVEEEDTEGPRPSETVAPAEVTVKKKKERGPNETFIIVRPPPSMSNHPLNLQIQLVPPQAKDRSASTSSNRRSVDFTNVQEDGVFEQGAPLARTSSGRSNRSDVASFYATQSSASMTSISSYASTASGAAGRRMIVPLYNLSAHNVMTNTILDAGTDAKIAKFHKRTLDILGVAILEPVEVWPGFGRPCGKPGKGDSENRLSVVKSLRKMGSRDSGAMQGANHEALTPTSSAVSLSSAGDSHLHTQIQPSTPTTATTAEFGMSTTPTSGAKKIFGRIFKKKDGSPALSGESTPATRQSRGPLSMLAPPSSPGSRSSFAARINRFSDSAAAPIPTDPAFPKSSSSQVVRRSLAVSSTSVESKSTSNSTQQPILQPPILGIQPTLSSPFSPPIGRSQKYVWVVKKWLKGTDNGILNGVMKGVGAGVGVLTGVASGVASGSNGSGGNGFKERALHFAANKGPTVAEGLEVRFEWTRSTKGHKRRSTMHGRRSLATRSQTSLVAEGNPGHTQSASSPAGTSNSRKSLGDRATRPSTVGTGRRSVESRRSSSPVGITSSGSRRRVGTTEGTHRDSRTNSMASTNASDEPYTGMVGDKLSTSPKSNVFVDRGTDDGEESDPEDSETPWSCVLVIAPISATEDDRNPRHSQLQSNYPEDGAMIDHVTSRPSLSHRMSEGSADATASQSSGALLRLKLGTLAPAPHHPKVVAQLKVPFPLPDVDVNRGLAIKRIVHPSGAITRSREADGVDGLFLAAEELKDILSSTALWVVVREGFGGVGKVNRKGDGWRIRA